MMNVWHKYASTVIIELVWTTIVIIKITKIFFIKNKTSEINNNFNKNIKKHHLQPHHQKHV